MQIRIALYTGKAPRAVSIGIKLTCDETFVQLSKSLKRLDHMRGDADRL